MKPEALRQIRSSLVLEAVAKAEDIRITDEKVDEEIEKMASSYNMDKEKLASMFPTSYSEDFLYQDGGDATASSFRSEDIGAKKMVDAYFKG